MGFLDFLFGNVDKKIKDFQSRGAIILDVRTKREYDSGAIVGCKHIPLQDLHQRFEELKQIDKPVIVYCASGVRSTKATKFLNLNNIEAINGGGIKHLKKILAK